MSEPTKFSTLLRLLDDESAVVRAAVTEELESIYDELPDRLAELDPGLTTTELANLEARLSGARQRVLRESWIDWMRADSGLPKLEMGLDLLSRYLSPLSRPTRVREHLDALAKGCRERFGNPTVDELSTYLFVEQGFRGATDDYYSTASSDLVDVIEERRGLPITLALVLILVGERLGLKIEGCNFPRHFYARSEDESGLYLIDAFRGGKRISEPEMVELFREGEDAVRVLLRLRTDAETMIRRVLRNLVVANQKIGQAQEVALFRDLFGQLERDTENRHRAGPVDPQSLSASQPDFVSGQLVRHKRADYRGVIVDYDLHCRADELWYRSNSTQPDRDQPWYHVFVHGTNVVTYAAQSSLQPDEDSGPIEHPLVPYFFSRVENGRYLRNKEPWPESWSPR